eukprot:7320128-Lingulodinium_polyedra.AAC.1
MRRGQDRGSPQVGFGPPRFARGPGPSRGATFCRARVAHSSGRRARRAVPRYERRRLGGDVWP